ncbi:hypothetical protein GGR56DRAFT_331002 [Xylariaceae sp. FL0804]|nr:hypothetical protein GGR56DRAFT_331002 [Xylariaceae sp. FL0804]
MPVPVVAKVGIVAVSFAVAAAIAVYESPELQRYAADLRRRLAARLHALGDRVGPQERENLFNRPEDAEGFLRSTRGAAAEPGGGMDADDETRRRQREELMYWNAVRQRKQEEEQEKRINSSMDPEKAAAAASRPRSHTRGSSFDDFLRQDQSAGEKGAFVYQTSHEPYQDVGSAIRRRGIGNGDGNNGTEEAPASRRLLGSYSAAAAHLANPFADEHGIIDEDVAFENDLMNPEGDELLSDIYSATDLGRNDEEPSPQSQQQQQQRLAPPSSSPSATLSAVTAETSAATSSSASSSSLLPALIDVSEEPTMPAEEPQQQQQQQQRSAPPSTEPELHPDEYMTAGQDDRQVDDAYSSIQAWAQGASSASASASAMALSSFYSPLPESPIEEPSPSHPQSQSRSQSEPELEFVSDADDGGQMTPTDSASLAGSGEEIGHPDRDHDHDAQSSRYGVVSDDEDEGMMTPASWTDVGSVVSSEGEGGAVYA